MEIFRKPSFADSTGDAIPFYHDGIYHIFSLTPPTGTTVYPERLRVFIRCRFYKNNIPVLDIIVMNARNGVFHLHFIYTVPFFCNFTGNRIG